MTATQTNTTPFSRLASVELLAKPGLAQFTESDGKLGQFLAGGEGKISGDLVQGSIRWDLYCDHNNPADCGNTIAGVIDTDDGAVVNFEMLGYADIVDPSQPHLWTMGFTSKFPTDDGRYGSLDGVLAHWTGQFNMATYRHHYEVFTA